MSALGASLLTAVVTAVLAVVGTYFTTRRSLEATFDTSLRDLRLEAYKTLWQDLQPLAKYDRPQALTREQARELAGTLRAWYFETGGLFLSHRTRQDYFALLDGLESATAAEKKRLREGDDEFLRVLGSRLRTGMTADVGTRRSFPFREASPDTKHHQRTYTDGTRKLVVSRGSRRYLLFGPYGLSLRVEGAGGDPHWDPTRRAFTAGIPQESGAVEERDFYLEGSQVVEGPMGWQRGETEARGGSVVWREGLPPPPAPEPAPEP
jgi:hypothetical protein